MTRDPMDEIARAAKKADAGAAPAPPESAKARKLRLGKVAAALRTKSLGENASMGATEVISGMIALALPPVGIAVFTSWDMERPLVLVPAVVAMAGAVLLNMTILPRVLAAWRTARLRRIGHGFDAERYLAFLSERRKKASLAVELQFRAPWKADEMESVAKAVGVWVPGARSRWKSEFALRVECGDFDGTSSFAGDDGSFYHFYTNRPLHDGFMRVVRRVMPRLDRVRAVTGLRVEVTGPTVPLDEPE